MVYRRFYELRLLKGSVIATVTWTPQRVKKIPDHVSLIGWQILEAFNIFTQMQKFLFERGLLEYILAPRAIFIAQQVGSGKVLASQGRLTNVLQLRAAVRKAFSRRLSMPRFDLAFVVTTAMNSVTWIAFRWCGMWQDSFLGWTSLQEWGDSRHPTTSKCHWGEFPEKTGAHGENATLNSISTTIMDQKFIMQVDKKGSPFSPPHEFAADSGLSPRAVCYI